MKKVLKYCFNTSVWSPTRLEYFHLLSALPTEEQTRISRFNFKSDLKQSLIGQILIRYCLKSLLGIESWTQLSLARTQRAKPYLKVRETLQNCKLASFNGVGGSGETCVVDFNLSHAGDFCIIAGGFVCEPGNSACESESLKIGTDVMKIDIAQSRVNNPLDDEETLFEKELGKHERIINSKFSSLEKAYIYNRPNPVEKLTAFYRLWCLKESYVKCLGDGMSFDLRRVECVINSELFIDLNLRKYLIALDTQLFIDSKLVKNCKFYEQYYMNNFQTQEKSHLHIMTVCVIEKAEKMSNAEKLKDRLKLGGSSSSSSISSIATSSSSSNSSSGSGFEMEFVQVTIQDLLANLVPLEKIDFEDAQKCQPFEEEWTKFCQKADKPF